MATSAWLLERAHSTPTIESEAVSVDWEAPAAGSTGIDRNRPSVVVG
jgi:hypothetical protein